MLLIPFGLWALVKEFGDPATMSFMDGFTIMHERVSADYFSLFNGPSAGEFPVQYIISLSVLAMVGTGLSHTQLCRLIMRVSNTYLIPQDQYRNLDGRGKTTINSLLSS